MFLLSLYVGMTSDRRSGEAPADWRSGNTSDPEGVGTSAAPLSSLSTAVMKATDTNSSPSFKPRSAAHTTRGACYFDSKLGPGSDGDVHSRVHVRVARRLEPDSLG